MAKRRREVVVKKRGDNALEVYADLDAESTIARVEGVMRVSSAPGFSHYAVLDLRYDIDEVAADIERAVTEAADARAEAAVAEAERVMREAM